jgi:LysM repeat protein
LLLSPPAANPASAISQPAASAPSQTYAAWSCRGVYHVVRRGETLYSIARRYGTTAYRIAVCNGLGSYTVYVGQTLLVPLGR